MFSYEKITNEEERQKIYSKKVRTFFYFIFILEYKFI